MITNAGLNADPADVPMKTFDPLGRADYYAEGIKYEQPCRYMSSALVLQHAVQI